MASITGLLDYNTPSVSTQRRTVLSPGANLGGFRNVQERNVVSGGGGGVFLGDSRTDPLEALIEGYDAESRALTNMLKSIYDNYTGIAGEIGDEFTPIFDQIDEDIDNFYGYMDEYQQLLTDIRPDFLSSIIVDPNAARTRNEYMGNVAAQYEAAEDEMRRQATQQGFNPYANRGATRDFNLSRAADLAGAANQAYSDWRGDYNRDIRMQQEADQAYAELFNRQGDQYGDLLNARSGVAALRKGIYDTRLEAERARAAGYEGLAGLVENRRSQALSLGQAQAAANAQAAAQANQMRANMPGQQWYNPGFNAGGSRTWS